MQIFFSLLLAYLYGSIPFSVIIPKMRGINIMDSGSGNPGFTNVLRIGGVGLGLACLFLDMSKGFLPAFLVSQMKLEFLGSTFSMQCLAGFIGVLGHCYSPFLKMRGGKGVAAAGGFIFALNYIIALILLSVLVLTIAVTKYMSVASMFSAVLFPVVVYLLYGDISHCLIPAFYSVFILYKHRSNISRLIKGTENKFSLSKRRRKESKHNVK